MINYVCIAKLFPSAGISGVLGVPVQDPKEVNEYWDAMGIVPGQQVRFVRLTAIPDHAKPHLKVGDIVCKFPGLSERFLDVLRPVETAYLASSWRTEPVDWEHAEEVRSRSIENNSWEASSDNYQIAICDPEGRLAVLRARKGTPKRLFKTAYAVLQETERDKMRMKVDKTVDYRLDPDRKKRCAWTTLRYLHGYLLKNGPIVDPEKLHWVRKLVRRHNEIVCSLPNPKLENRQIRMHTRRRSKHAREFWHRIRREYLIDSEKLPRPLAFIASKREVRWIRVTLDEVEEVLKYIDWPEWKDIRDPVHFSNLNYSVESGSKAWN